MSFSKVVLLLLKYTRGSTPPTVWPSTVAIAAPASPQPNTMMNNASRAKFVRPAATMNPNPTWGLPAVANNDSNAL